MTKKPLPARGYEATYEVFDSPLMETIRREAYGEDIGQHSWVTASELREAIQSLNLDSTSHVLDFGCGPCGPATFIAKECGCKVTGIDVSPAALSAGKRRAESMGLSHLLDLHHVDGNVGWPNIGTFDAIVSFDVVLHLQNRALLYEHFLSMVRPGGKVLVTDAGVVCGPISNEEFKLRSINGFTQFVPAGYNEQTLDASGFSLIARSDGTENLIRNASGRLSARATHSAELVAVEGTEKFHSQQEYLHIVIELAERRALTRMSYLVTLKQNR